MKLNELKNNIGATHAKKRVGRGMSSGTGKTAGRGHKGAKARAGARKIATFQGGQKNVLKRFPKFGFVNPFRKEFVEINLSKIAEFIKLGRIDASKDITIDSLIVAKVIKKKMDGLKVLGDGKLDGAVNIKAAKWSKSAEAAITAAGGTIIKE